MDGYDHHLEVTVESGLDKMERSASQKPQKCGIFDKAAAHEWEQKSLKMFYFTPIVANGKLVKLKGKQQLLENEGKFSNQLARPQSVGKTPTK